MGSLVEAQGLAKQALQRLCGQPGVKVSEALRLVDWLKQGKPAQDFNTQGSSQAAQPGKADLAHGQRVISLDELINKDPSPESVAL